jgi:hypothetical protein
VDWLNTLLPVVLGFGLRFVVPVVLTIVVIWWFRRLDDGWKKEAERIVEVENRPRPGNPGCWKFNHCSPEDRAKCRAFAHPDQPCWQVFRAKDGRMLDRCLACQVFRTAPVPA